jgi:hypothetical protein
MIQGKKIGEYGEEASFICWQLIRGTGMSAKQAKEASLTKGERVMTQAYDNVCGGETY